MGASMSSYTGLEHESTPVTSVAYPGIASYILYYIVFGLMTASAIFFGFLTFKQPMHLRVHGYITMLIVTIAASAYFSMASAGGDSVVPLYWNLGQARDVFWARYVDWFLTTPLLLLDLLVMAAVPVGTFLWVMIADILMILFGLWGAITTYHSRWGYYAIGCFWMFIVFWGLLVTGPKYARLRSSKLASWYIFLSVYLMVLFCLYPIVWGLAEGSNTIAIVAEVAAYGVLDVLAKVVFGFLVLVGAGPAVHEALNQERERETHDISILEAPLTAPLSGIRQRIHSKHQHREGMELSPAGVVPVPVAAEVPVAYQSVAAPTMVAAQPIAYAQPAAYAQPTAVVVDGNGAGRM